MKIVNSIKAVREFVKEQRQAGRTIGLVPTMGYLHEGHLSLVKTARKATDTVVMSIFVNPAQFGAGEDYGTYPRDLDHDAALAETAGVDLIFAPPIEEIYPQGFNTFVEVENLTDKMCGRSRPGHFCGVATVVAKLFNIIQPDQAFFGQKDAQQVAIIKRMVADLNFPLQIVTCPLIRETDGLALSSRNTYLDVRERKAALILSRSLKLAEKLITDGERDPGIILAQMKNLISTEPLAEIDYIEIYRADDLADLTRIEGRVLIALAVKIGKTRLIDNLVAEAL